MAYVIILLIAIWLLHPLKAQQLGIWVLNTSVATEQNRNMTDRNPYSLSGHDMRMVCRYENESICASRNSISLAIDPAGSQNRTLVQKSMKIFQRKKCELIVDFVKMTQDLTGEYHCKDLDNEGIHIPAVIHVGEAPVMPRNISAIYRPLGNITLLLDPVKTAADLNDSETKWKVTYNWNGSTKTCVKEQSDRQCSQLTDGLCQPCFILLQIYGSGQYGSQGHIGNSITFTIVVKNRFGEVEMETEIYLPDWVKPGPLINITARPRTSWLSFSTAIEDWDAFHENISWLRVGYTVDFVYGKAQSLLHEDSRAFHELHGLVRNWQDDEAALNHTLLSTTFPNSSTMRWRERRRRHQAKITNLPYAGYFYNVTVFCQARYVGGTNSTMWQTQEARPSEGPRLHDSFAYCPPSSQPCTTCFIYFQEIPRPRRGGIIQKHTLSLTLLNSKNLPVNHIHSCEHCISLEVGGQNNTFVARKLYVGGIYNVTLQAVNKEGASPISSKIFHVHSFIPSVAPTNIVLESDNTAYRMSWVRGDLNSQEKPTHFVHTCYTTPLNVQRPESADSGDWAYNEASKPLNCVTNMVAERPPENDSSFTFRNVLPYKDLTPAFFISMVTAQGHSSGLLPVDCFYSKRASVEEATPYVQKSSPDSLQVTFTLPCGQGIDSKHGRPESYAIGVLTNDSCKTACSSVMRNSDFDTRKILGKLKDQFVEYTKKGLVPDTSYCVGINLIGYDDVVHDDRWCCIVASTQGADFSAATFGAVSGTVCVVLVIMICRFGCKRLKNAKQKFGRDIVDLHQPGEKEAETILDFLVLQTRRLSTPSSSVQLATEPYLTQSRDETRRLTTVTSRYPPWEVTPPDDADRYRVSSLTSGPGGNGQHENTEDVELPESDDSQRFHSSSHSTADSEESDDDDDIAEEQSDDDAAKVNSRYRSLAQSAINHPEMYAGFFPR